MNFKTSVPSKDIKIKSISAGYGHSAAVTSQGDIYTWGFNIHGQLGFGDRKTRIYPRKIVRDILSNDLPFFDYVSCGHHNTYAIDGKKLIISKDLYYINK